ncbi:uncharacterized protein HMPREF1541_08819 [Cyphellophora europaea CBS 101466]|uniref:GPI anchored protein n=1 Tax=Cyphellophora europaea (strain CBS 101466) TaxID=1220924 RepID=W2RJ92_CYPE1|nr:uncharacterized protein HMPREF1541_08819 [Cyphellophora europaea CBS 101466]ETN36541.1 hypothetical protein HMPREF1541_08819 [Cyphellophora europaea CBS 101466]
MQQHQYILSSLLLAASAIHAQTTTLNDIFAPPDSSNSRTDLFTPTSTGSDFSSSTASPSVSGTPATVYFVALEGTAVSIDPDVELLASVIAAEPSATTYHIAEIIGGPNVQYPIMTIVNGPSTYGLQFTSQNLLTMDTHCAISSGSIGCTIDASVAGTGTTVTTTYATEDIAFSEMPVTITGGVALESLPSEAPGAAAESNGDGASGSGSGSGSSENGAARVGGVGVLGLGLAAAAAVLLVGS